MSTKSPSQALNKTLSQLQNQIQLAKNSLEHIQVELTYLQQQREALEHKIEVETVRLKADQRNSVNTYIVLIRKDIKTIQAQLEVSRKVFEEQQMALKLQQEEAFAAEEAITNDKKSLATIMEQTTTAEDNLLQLRRDYASEEKRRLDLNTDINSLRNSHSQLTNDVVTAQSNVDYYERSADEQKIQLTELQEQVTKLQRVLQTIEAASVGAKQDYKHYVQSTEALRTDLANRQLALDDREQVLKSREYKVSMKEGIAMHNDALMNL